ncbi:MAG: HPr family phosphocarrier protein [Oscillospiraceae bacterium]|nr:HPr family phosphocarrier protein [Oscillospiraceae bacterium]
MKKVQIRLSAIEDIRKFVDSVKKYSLEATLKSGRYIVSASSIMGIFTLDLMKPVELTINGDNYAPLLNEVSKYLVSEQ